MRTAFAITVGLVSAVLLAGCLSKPPARPNKWLIEAKTAAVSSRPGATTLARTVRVSAVTARAPYDGASFVVLRPNGEVVFDGYNTFAASPVTMMRAAAEEIARSCGRFADVLAYSSSAVAECSLEITVRRLALDCRTEGARNAIAELEVALVKGRETLARSQGVSSLPESGDYSSVFSFVFSDALAKALERL